MKALCVRGGWTGRRSQAPTGDFTVAFGHGHPLVYDNQMSSVSFASAYWASFCPHPLTNVPFVHITQTPTICTHRPTCLRPTDPWHICSYRPPTKQFWFFIRLSTRHNLIQSMGGNNWCDASTFHWQWCQHSNKLHRSRHHIWHPFGLQVPFKCKQINGGII
jgi:hypothetical protein